MKTKKKVKKKQKIVPIVKKITFVTKDSYIELQLPEDVKIPLKVLERATMEELISKLLAAIIVRCEAILIHCNFKYTATPPQH